MRTHPKNCMCHLCLPGSALAPAAGSVADVDGEPTPNEHEAIAIGLALLNAKWSCRSDFDKGMRLLQKQLKIKR